MSSLGERADQRDRRDRESVSGRFVDPLALGLGLLNRFQAVPFQCRISARLAAVPTAQALEAEVAVTAAKVLPAGGSFLMLALDQVLVVPFQCKISAWLLPVK